MPVYVNDVEITDEEVYAEMQYHPAASPEEARGKAAQVLVVRELLIQAAQEKDLLNAAEPTSTEKIDEAIDLLIGQEVSVPEADEQSCKRYYEQNQERFLDKKSQRPLPFEYVFSYIQSYLHARSLQTGISQYIKLLARRARLVGFDLEESDDPLVQ